MIHIFILIEKEINITRFVLKCRLSSFRFLGGQKMDQIGQDYAFKLQHMTKTQTSPILFNLTIGKPQEPFKNSNIIAGLLMTPLISLANMFVRLPRYLDTPNQNIFIHKIDQTKKLD